MTLKKFSVILAFFLTVFAVQFAVVSEVEARDVYVGTSDTTGRDCYLVMDSIRYGANRSFSCTLKMVRPSTGDVQFLYYDFWVGNYGYFHFQNSQGFSGIADRQCPIEFRMVQVAAP